MGLLESNGATILLGTAASSGVEVCFANPGTTEMPLVWAFDVVPSVRAVLGLFEGVCTGAADGWGRMRRFPALTLLHLGPGFANGIANLHNARRARTPIVNVVGDHASWHLKYDAPLTSDILSLAKPVSAWYRASSSAADLRGDMRAAIDASIAAPGVATLVVPVDFQQAENVAAPRDVQEGAATAPPEHVDAVALEKAARLLTSDAKRVVLLIGGRGLSVRGLTAAGRIIAATGCRAWSETFPARAERGLGTPDIDRLPYFPEAAIAALDDATVILAGALAPVAYFGYQGIPSELAAPDRLLHLSLPSQASDVALEALADELRAPVPAIASGKIADPEPGALTPASVGRLLSRALPGGAIVSVEGGTCGYPFFSASAHAQAHTVLTNTGGAIGQGLPVAFGAALACPDRRVFALQSDGSAQYTIQTLWSMARESTPITILVASNRRYGILQTELGRAGRSTPGPQAQRLTLLDSPPFDWVALAKGYGVEASRAGTADELRVALARSANAAGPMLIEMLLA